MIKDETFDAIVNALDSVTGAMLALSDNRQLTALPSLNWATTLTLGPIKSRTEMEVDQLIEDPVYYAMRQAVRKLGAILHASDPTLMDGAINDVADRPKGGRKVSIIDHAWDGIGQWYA